jgi:hypothetical protein
MPKKFPFILLIHVDCRILWDWWKSLADEIGKLFAKLCEMLDIQEYPTCL